MKVKIKFLNGNINIYEPKNCNILNLKQEIINDKNILLEDIKLIYRGKILQNNENFEFHKIDENSILHCVIKKKKSNIVQQTINNNNLLNISDINIIYNNPEFKELVISSILNKLNLPIDSPYRHIIDINLNTILINSDLSEQIESNMNNANDNLTNFINLFDNLNIDPLQLNVGCDEIEINDDLRNKFKDELDEIKLMGFDNDHLILRTLAESNGSISITINKLLE